MRGCFGGQPINQSMGVVVPFGIGAIVIGKSGGSMPFGGPPPRADYVARRDGIVLRSNI